jgi:4-hydroxybenzoate polyprenyltransferase
MIAWTFLMAEEFFCREWIRRRLVLYAVSHMLITPFAMTWAILLASPGARFGASETLFLSVTFISGFAFELARKSRGPEEERPTLDSYSKLAGPRACAYVLLGLLAAIFVNELLLLAAAPGRISASPRMGIVGCALIPAIAAAIAYLRAPSAARRKANEAFSGLFMLTNYLCVAAAWWL